MNAETITTLAAVLLGWLLGLVQQWLQTGKSKRETRRSTRHLIHLECDSNASALQAFWDTILARKQEWQPDGKDIVTTRLGSIIAASPFPNISTFAWISNASLLSDAFTDAEIDHLWHTYGEYTLLSTLHAHLMDTDSYATDSARYAGQLTGHASSMMSVLSFLHRAGNTVEVFKATIEKLIDQRTTSASTVRPTRGTPRAMHESRHDPAVR